MRPLYKVSIAAGTLIGLVAGAITYTRELENSFPKPNILVLSLCSLRKSEMDLFSGAKADPSLTPNINKAFANGIALDNVYSSYGWTNLALYFLKIFDEKYLNANGYEAIDDDWRPLRLTVRGQYAENGRLEQMVNEIHPKLKYLQQRMGLFHPRPFFAYVHIKYMHYPYIDGLNENSNWDQFLNEDDKKHIERVLSDPKEVRERMPFALTLSSDMNVLKKAPEFLPKDPDPYKVFFGLYNILLDKTVLTRWSKQTDYEKDLSILRKVYRAKLNKLDQILAPVLDLYGRKDLLENTILVLMGDHGEAFMEHGHLGHAMHVYDEILTPPVLVRFPRQWRLKPERVGEQIYMGSLADWLSDAIAGKSKEKDFLESVRKNPRNKYIVSRNCSNNVHSVRDDNKWKFIFDRPNREKMLFDLEKDPGEKTNVIEQNPQVAAELELYLSSHLEDLDAIVDSTPCHF